MKHTKEEFLAWLRSLPENTVFCEGMRIETCPIAKFTGRLACTDDPSNPDWVNRFMFAYDENRSTSLVDAIQIAEDL